MKLLVKVFTYLPSDGSQIKWKYTETISKWAASSKLDCSTLKLNVHSQTNETVLWNSTVNNTNTNSSKMAFMMENTMGVSNYSIMEPDVGTKERRNMSMGVNLTGGSQEHNQAKAFTDICPTTLRASFSYSRCTYDNNNHISFSTSFVIWNKINNKGKRCWNCDFFPGTMSPLASFFLFFFSFFFPGTMFSSATWSSCSYSPLPSYRLVA